MAQGAEFAECARVVEVRVLFEISDARPIGTATAIDSVGNVACIAFTAGFGVSVSFKFRSKESYKRLDSPTCLS